MYKSTSRALQHAHGVDRAHPSRGYIMGDSDPLDVIADVASMPLDKARAEMAQLRVEMRTTETLLMEAKANRSKSAKDILGQRKITLQTRLSAVKRRVAELDGDSELHRLRSAVRELAGDDLADRIFERAKAMRQMIGKGE